METKVKVKVPNRSGFDKSHQNILTTKVGTLTPVLTDELIPNSHVNLEAAVSASLPPLASDTFMRCDLKMEAFFVPTRLLYGGYEKWLTEDKVYDNFIGDDVPVKLPNLYLQANAANYPLYKPGTLFDYLGGKVTSIPSSSNVSSTFNLFPFLAYHRIYDDWYRNTNVQRPLFFPIAEDGEGEVSFSTLSSLPYRTYVTDHSVTLDTTFDNDPTGTGEATKLGDLHQRNFGLDYFTIASPTAQRGDAKSVKFNTSGTEGSFTISALRAANSLQQFAERNSLAGFRMQDFVKNQYGADLSSGVAQRAIYLGSASFNVYSKGVYQTNSSSASTSASRNPFNSVAAEYGSANATGESTLVKDFTAQEPGYLMVIASLVPRVTYSSGINRMLYRYNREGNVTDMANPMLQNVGNQPIYAWELNADNYFSPDGKPRDFVFGYTDRYGDWKTMNDELHGLVRDGESLEAFALQRTLDGTPTISGDFLKIPTDYLDQVSAVAGDISQYGLWMDTFFKYHVSMPLDEYSIPSLQDPAYEHGHDVVVDTRGSRL